jgi:HlyD family secretion protein
MSQEELSLRPTRQPASPTSFDRLAPRPPKCTIAFRALLAGLGLAALGAAACRSSAPAPVYEKVPVGRRDLVVSVSASGDIEPVLTVDIKSKASGEIMQMPVQTGDDVRAGQLLARIDPRLPRNTLAQAEANLEVAKAQLENAQAQLTRSETLFKTQLITEIEHDNAKLNYATAKAQVVRSESDLETARDAMADTDVRAPAAGTILAKNVELGTVISSPTRDVGGGTVLLKMANLDTMQVRTLVDETDIGKVQPGIEATITVQAFPNHPFQARVRKIEPQATVQQNVTMFPVLLGIENANHLLKPGMNTEVEMHVGERHGVVAIPNAALRTQRDVTSAAQVLGLDPEAVQKQLASAQEADPAQSAHGAAPAASTAPGGAGAAAAAPAPTSTAGTPSQAGSGAASGTKMTLPNGREVTLPPGVSQEQVRAAMQKRMSGGELAPAEQALLRQVFAGMRGSGGGRQGGGGGRADQAASYIVFAMRGGKPAAVPIRTGLTDLDYVEVMSGLVEGDTVLVLPSASLLQQQKEFKDRFQRMTGGGLPGLQQQQQPTRTQTR